MSFYNVEVIFTGLCFFCFSGADPTACPDRDPATYVYLVNASEPQRVCEKDLPGDHEAILAFDRRFLEYAEASDYKLMPSPDGGQLVVARFDGQDICFREECTDPNGCDPPWPRSPESADSLVGRAENQEAPEGLRPDANHIDWLASVPHVETSCQDYDLRGEVSGLDPEYVAGRVRLDWGTLSTHNHARRPRKMLSRPYVVWETPDEPVGDMPKALAGDVRLILRRLKGALLVQTDCSSTPRTLFRLRGAPYRLLQVHIANLPTHEVDPAGQTAQHHFRWYYRLYDWPYQYPCPEDVALPSVRPEVRGRDGKKSLKQLAGVISGNTLCPPAGESP